MHDVLREIDLCKTILRIHVQAGVIFIEVNNLLLVPMHGTQKSNLDHLMLYLPVIS